MNEHLNTEFNDDQVPDAWRQTITPSPSFTSSSKSYTTANTSPASFNYQVKPLVRQELLHTASEGIYSSKVPRKYHSYYKVNIFFSRTGLVIFTVHCLAIFYSIKIMI